MPETSRSHSQGLLQCVGCGVMWLAAAGLVRGDWPAFRGPSRDGIVAASDVPRLPTEWTDSVNVAWRTELPGQGWSSPVIVGNRCFLTAAIPERNDASGAAQGSPVEDNGEDSGAGYRLCLLEVDTRSGELVRSIALFDEPADAPRIHQKNSHASPTPVYDGSHLFVHFGHQGTACVSLAGQVVWRNQSLSYAPVHGNGGSAAVVNDLLVFSRDGGDVAEVVALHKSTGEIAWRTSREVTADRSFSFCTPLVADIEGRQQLILPGSNVVQSLDPKSGRELWRVTYDGYSVIPRPIYASGLVFVCTGYNRPRLMAIDPTGVGDVTESHVRWTVDSNIPHTPSLVSQDGRVVLVSDKGIASCLDAQTGELIWKERIGGNFSASPLLVGNNVYFLSEQGDCTVLNVQDQPIEVAKNRMGERCLASLAIVDQDFLLRTESALYRISN